MARRVLELVVTGKDQSSAALASAESSVTSLGSSVAGTDHLLMSFAEHVEEGRRMMAALPSSGDAAAASIGRTGASSSKAIQPLMYLASSFGVISRRSAVAVGRVQQLGRAISESGGAAGAAGSSWVILGAAALGAIMVLRTGIGVVKAIGGAAISLGRKVADWAGIFDRAESSVDRTASSVRRLGRVIQIGSADLATSGRSVQFFSGSVDELDSHLRQMLGQPMGSTMNRWDAAVSGLGSSVGTALAPAVDALIGSLIPLINQYGPDVIAWAQDAGQWLGVNLPGAIEWTVNAVEKLASALSLLVRTSPLYQLGGLLTTGQLPLLQGGTPSFGGGWAILGEKGPELARLPRGTQVLSNQESQQMMGGHTINVHIGSFVGVAPREAGRQIGRGIQAELQRIGLE